jgi:hypothetical protein
MSRSGVFYAVRAMEWVAAGTAADDVPGAPGGRAVARQAPTEPRPDGSNLSPTRRVLAAVHRGMRGARGRGGRRLGGAARAD